MQRVSIERAIDEPPEAVREALSRVEPFVAASGFDEVTVAGDTVEVANEMGVATIELTLELVDDRDADLAFVQTEGLFEEMAASYVVVPAEGGSLVTATTEFALDVAVVGSVLDATVVKRQRRSELKAQFDWLAETAARAAQRGA
jgi:carbon monoxide dehydrogenase subunit G